MLFKYHSTFMLHRHVHPPIPIIKVMPFLTILIYQLKSFKVLILSSGPLKDGNIINNTKLKERWSILFCIIRMCGDKLSGEPYNYSHMVTGRNKSPLLTELDYRA